MLPEHKRLRKAVMMTSQGGSLYGGIDGRLTVIGNGLMITFMGWLGDAAGLCHYDDQSWWISGRRH